MHHDEEKERDDLQATDPQANGEASASAEKAAGETAGDGPDPRVGDTQEAENHDGQDAEDEPWTSPEEELRQRVAEMEQALADKDDKLLRLLAEFENFKRRSARERIELRQTAAEDLIVDLLSVLDDFDRARAALDKDPEKGVDPKGILLIANKFRGVLQARGLQGLDAMGKDFDPEWHEAITEIPAPRKKLRGKVVDVIEPGYRLGEKIIRYAKVVVGK